MFKKNETLLLNVVEISSQNPYSGKMSVEVVLCCISQESEERKKMFLTCKELSVWLCEPGAALQPELHFYEPTDTIALEHVVLIASRAKTEAS